MPPRDAVSRQRLALLRRNAAWHRQQVAAGDTSAKRLRLLAQAERRLAELGDMVTTGRKTKTMTEKQLEAATATEPPAYVAHHTFNAGGQRISRGALLTVSAVRAWPNHRALINARAVLSISPDMGKFAGTATAATSSETELVA
jgi:hypothetical protein